MQNAEDATKETKTKEKNIKFLIKDDKMIITNNGEEFHMKNVESISEVHSTKVGKNTIGYWGIGFKSIFLVSDKVQIFSENFRFEFNKDRFLNSTGIDSEFSDLFVTVPYWVEEVPEDIKGIYEKVKLFL